MGKCLSKDNHQPSLPQQQTEDKTDHTHLHHIEGYLQRRQRGKNGLTQKELHAQIDKMFNLYDLDKDQKLNKKEITMMLNTFYSHSSKRKHLVTKDEVQDFIDYAHRNSTQGGCITREEFHRFYKQGIK